MARRCWFRCGSAWKADAEQALAGQDWPALLAALAVCLLARQAVHPRGVQFNRFPWFPTWTGNSSPGCAGTLLNFVMVAQIVVYGGGRKAAAGKRGKKKEA